MLNNYILLIVRTYKLDKIIFNVFSGFAHVNIFRFNFRTTSCEMDNDSEKISTYDPLV